MSTPAPCAHCQRRDHSTLEHEEALEREERARFVAAVATAPISVEVPQHDGRILYGWKR